MHGTYAFAKVLMGVRIRFALTSDNADPKKGSELFILFSNGRTFGMAKTR